MRLLFGCYLFLEMVTIHIMFYHKIKHYPTWAYTHPCPFVPFNDLFCITLMIIWNTVKQIRHACENITCFHYKRHNLWNVHIIHEKCHLVYISRLALHLSFLYWMESGYTPNPLCKHVKTLLTYFTYTNTQV